MSGYKHALPHALIGLCYDRAQVGKEIASGSRQTERSTTGCLLFVGYVIAAFVLSFLVAKSLLWGMAVLAGVAGAVVAVWSFIDALREKLCIKHGGHHWQREGCWNICTRCPARTDPRHDWQRKGCRNVCTRCYARGEPCHDWQRKGCWNVCTRCYARGEPYHDLSKSNCECQRCHEVKHDLGESWHEVVGGHYGSSSEGQTWYDHYARCNRCREVIKTGESAGP